MTEYLPILIFLIFAFLLSFGAFFLSIFAGKRSSYAEKTSTYECGFEPFDDSRGRFEVKFYLVAILFIIFDLEIIFIPMGSSIFRNRIVWVSINDVFLFVLTVGFVYEWMKGALDWS